MQCRWWQLKICEAPCQCRLHCAAVIDKWGYLWTGGGTYTKAGSYIIVRVDPNSGMVQFFLLAHQAQVCSASCLLALDLL